MLERLSNINWIWYPNIWALLKWVLKLYTISKINDGPGPGGGAHLSPDIAHQTVLFVPGHEWVSRSHAVSRGVTEAGTPRKLIIHAMAIVCPPSKLSPPDLHPADGQPANHRRALGSRDHRGPIRGGHCSALCSHSSQLFPVQNGPWRLWREEAEQNKLSRNE